MWVSVINEALWHDKNGHWYNAFNNLMACGQFDSVTLRVEVFPDLIVQ